MAEDRIEIPETLADGRPVRTAVFGASAANSPQGLRLIRELERRGVRVIIDTTWTQPTAPLTRRELLRIRWDRYVARTWRRFRG